MSGRAYRPLQEMKAAGYRIELDFLWLPQADQSIQRVARRVEHGGHDIPVPVILRRHRKGLVNLFGVYRSVLDRWTIFDNMESPPHRIAEEIGGNLRVYDMDQFAKITQIAEGAGNE